MSEEIQTTKPAVASSLKWSGNATVIVFALLSEALRPRLSDAWALSLAWSAAFGGVSLFLLSPGPDPGLAGLC